MNDDKKNLRGSDSRDIFKLSHKLYCPSSFYACDIDFVLVDKYPYRIIAFLDYKKQYDRITFSEVIAYNSLKPIAPIYIIWSRSPDKGPFTITDYISGDPGPHPPLVTIVSIRQCEDWNELKDWEKTLRLQSVFG